MSEIHSPSRISETSFTWRREKVAKVFKCHNSSSLRAPLSNYGRSFDDVSRGIKNGEAKKVDLRRLCEELSKHIIEAQKLVKLDEEKFASWLLS